MVQTLERLINEEGEILIMENKATLPTPSELKAQYPLTQKAKETVHKGRKTISNILTQQDPRFLIITGPCSIDDINTATKYAQKLKQLSQEVGDKIFLVMRTYFEKPRTTVGWKGLIYDPKRDETYQMLDGLIESRQLTIDVGELAVPTATEFLNPLVADYISDGISWGAIGARTSESQTHRELAVSLPMPVGFKNTTEGNVKTAIASVQAASSNQTYLGLSENNERKIITVQGNHNAHLILRGGTNGTNYDQESIKNALQTLEDNNQQQRVIVDCSHANSNKKPENQPKVALSVANQRQTNPYISGIMLESYLIQGKGDLCGQSKTDGCIDWETTKKVINEIYSVL